MNIKEFLAHLIRRFFECRVIVRAIEFLDARSANRMSEVGMIRQAFTFACVNQVKGDYFEFGIWQGKTFICAHRMKRQLGLDKMTLLGFDSFQGLPEIDDKNDNIWHQGAFACSEKNLREILRRAGFRNDEYELVSGFYEKSLNEALHARLSGRRAAVVYVDCDLYTSTKQVLGFICRYLVNGSIVCFDDYYNYKGAPDQGEQKAVAEFLASHPEIEFIPYMNYCPLGKSFIVRCRQ